MSGGNCRLYNCRLIPQHTNILPKTLHSVHGHYVADMRKRFDRGSSTSGLVSSKGSHAFIDFRRNVKHFNELVYLQLIDACQRSIIDELCKVENERHERMRRISRLRLIR